MNALIEQLLDPQTRRVAWSALLQQGSASVDALLAALVAEQDPDRRLTLLSLLVELRDRRAEALFRATLQSPDERLRSLSARGLHRLGAPDAPAASLATLNDAPDPAHFDVTASVLNLIEMGLPAVEAVLPLLASPHDRTRQRAQRVLEGVSQQVLTEQLQPRSLENTVNITWQELWRRNGDYRWDAPEPQRRAALEHWRQWLVDQASSVAQT